MDKKELTDYFNKLPFWAHLSAMQRELFLSQIKKVHYEAGEAVISEKNNCLGALFILRGKLRVYLLAEDGRQITIYRLQAGEACVLTASCALPAINLDVQIDAEENAALLLIPTSVFSALMQENIYLEAFAYRLTCEHFSSIMAAVEKIFFMSLEQRVATFLVEEAAQRSSAFIPITQEKLAMAIGSAREAVSRTLNQFSKAGIVSLSRGSIQILDPDALSARCIR